MGGYLKNCLKIALCAFWWLLAASAHAQSVQSFEGMMNNIIRGTPGVTNVAVSGGVRSSVSGAVGVAGRSGTISVATTAAAQVSTGAIAAGAARVAVRAVPWVGTAIAVKEIGEAIADSGIKTCPPPSFFCKTGSQSQTDTTTPTTVFGKGFPTVAAACADWAARSTAAQTNTNSIWTVYSSQEVAPYSCQMKCSNCGTAAGNYPPQASCPTDYMLSMDKTICTRTTTVNVPEGTPASNQELNDALKKKFDADTALAAALKAKLDAISSSNPGMQPVVDVTTAPLTITSPAVTTPSTQVSTETYPNPDGSTSTKRIMESTTVTPTVNSPSTVGNPNISYPSTTTQTTTITNNTTNQTSTTVTNITNPTQTPAPTEKEFPKDYNREVTQQKILDALTEPVTDTPPTGDTDLASIKAKNDEGLTVVGNITEGSTGLKSWLPTIKTSACVNPQVASPVTGAMLAVPICDSVDTFAKFISAVISVFALYGCIREVQAAMKA